MSAARERTLAVDQVLGSLSRPFPTGVTTAGSSQSISISGGGGVLGAGKGGGVLGMGLSGLGSHPNQASRKMSLLIHSGVTLPSATSSISSLVMVFITIVAVFHACFFISTSLFKPAGMNSLEILRTSISFSCILLSLRPISLKQSKKGYKNISPPTQPSANPTPQPPTPTKGGNLRNLYKC